MTAGGLSIAGGGLKVAGSICRHSISNNLYYVTCSFSSLCVMMYRISRRCPLSVCTYCSGALKGIHIRFVFNLLIESEKKVLIIIRKFLGELYYFDLPLSDPSSNWKDVLLRE